MACVMKQLREKHVSAEISKCLWSPKMDLLAIANVQGQVILHRLSWQQVWTLNPPVDQMKVTALAWRMDSKILAVGYLSGRILLANIEDGSTIHELELKEEISALSWNQCISSTNETSGKEEYPWASYMYPLPPLSKSFPNGTSLSTGETWQEPRLLQDQSDLNVLSVGTMQGSLHLYAFGLFHIATVNLSIDENEAESPSSCGKVVNITPSPSLDFFSVVLEKNTHEEERILVWAKVDTPLIASRHAEVRILAQKYGQIHTLMAYIGKTLALTEEAWESALLEMDAKLASYAASSGSSDGGVAADFLDLLVFGHASAEFEVFLTSRLTEKNLKRLRHALDLCYSTMQRLVVRHLQQVGVTLLFLLSQVEGMSKRKERFGALGVGGIEVETAMSQVGSFLLKASEMLQAIESSMRDFHVFVRWVSGVHLRLLREHVPAELSRMSQQETTGLLHFLNDSFEEVVTGSDGQRRTHFRLERAGQYLKREELKTLSHSQPTPFAQLIATNPALAAHRLIFKHNSRTSLLQEHENLTEALTRMGAQPAIAISASVCVRQPLPLARLELGTGYTVSQVAHPDGALLTAVVPCVRQSTLLVMESPQGKAAAFTLGDGSSPSSILDTQFYSPDTLSLLVFDPADPRSPSFAQLSLSPLRTSLAPFNVIHSGTTLLAVGNPLLAIPSEAISFRRLEAGSAAAIAVSGPRRLAAIIGENRRRVRLYEMETEEEDEEEEEADESSVPSKNELSSILSSSSLTASDLNETS